MQKAPSVTAWKQRQAQLQAIDSWDIRGRLSIRNEQQVFPADLFWQQQQQHLMLRLVAPFGQGTTQISRVDGQDYRVITPQGQQIMVDSPASLTLYAFGVALPYQELQYWIRGLPAETGHVWRARFDEQNRLIAFQQNGWDIRILRYQHHGDVDLPNKIFLSLLNDSDEPLGDRVDVRLIIQRWQL